MTHQNIIDCMSKCPDFLDFPTAWAIQRHTSLAHDAKCSSIAGHHPLSGPHFLCDCGAVIKEWERLTRNNAGAILGETKQDDWDARK